MITINKPKKLEKNIWKIEIKIDNFIYILVSNMSGYMLESALDFVKWEKIIGSGQKYLRKQLKENLYIVSDSSYVLNHISEESLNKLEKRFKTSTS